MSKNIITVSREFGSGGRSIAKRVAESLGGTYYDKELVKQVAVETGLSESFIEEEGEYAPNKSWLYFFIPQRNSGCNERPFNRRFSMGNAEKNRA